MRKLLFLILFIFNLLIIFSISFKQKTIRKKIFKNENIFLKTKYKFFNLRLIILILINILFLISSKDLSLGYKKTKVSVQNKYGIILLDNSTSMLANDVLPSRFEVSKIYSQILIENIKNINYALILFSSFPILQVPFTDDINYLKFIIQNLYIPENNFKSSRLISSLKQSIILLNRLPDAEKFIFIFSDMEFFDEINLQTIKNLNLKNIKLYFFIIGTEEGGKIPLANGFLKDSKGKEVITYANNSKIIIFENVSNAKFFVINGLQSKYIDNIKKDIVKKERKTFYVYKPYKIYHFILFLIYIFLIIYFLVYSKLYKIDLIKEFSYYNEKKEKK